MDSQAVEVDITEGNASGNTTNSSGSVTEFQNAEDLLENDSMTVELQTEQRAEHVKCHAMTEKCGQNKRTLDTSPAPSSSYAANKNIAEGMMDIALLSANANQLRFLITYNSASSTYYISLGLIVVSLVMQVSVGIALIFKHRMKRCDGKRFARTNEFLVGGVFMVTVVNILLAAFTTTDERT